MIVVVVEVVVGGGSCTCGDEGYKIEDIKDGVNKGKQFI